MLRRKGRSPAAAQAAGSGNWSAPTRKLAGRGYFRPDACMSLSTHWAKMSGGDVHRWGCSRGFEVGGRVALQAEQGASARAGAGECGRLAQADDVPGASPPFLLPCSPVCAPDVASLTPPKEKMYWRSEDALRGFGRGFGRAGAQQTLAGGGGGQARGPPRARGAKKQHSNASLGDRSPHLADASAPQTHQQGAAPPSACMLPPPLSARPHYCPRSLCHQVCELVSHHIRVDHGPKPFTQGQVIAVAVAEKYALLGGWRWVAWG
jgi:hypothetical protein